LEVFGNREISGAAWVRPKRPWSPRNKLANTFTGALYQFSTVRKYMERTVGLKMTSVTDDVIDWPLPNKILGCATAWGISRPPSAVGWTTFPNGILGAKLMKNEHIFGKFQIYRIFKVPTIYARENAP